MNKSLSFLLCVSWISFRDAVQKMGKDIMACRDYIIALKKDNTKLKNALSKLQEPIHDVSLMNVARDDLIKEVIRSRRALRDQVMSSSCLNNVNHTCLIKFKEDCLRQIVL